MHPKYTPPEIARFWSRVDKTDSCWLWTGPTNPKYGVYVVSGKEREYAHRYSWIATHGPIPDGLFVLHRCDTPRCVNPAHLWLGTHDDNMRDMVEKGRSQKGDKNVSRRFNASVQRGEEHWSHRRPALVMRGDSHANAKLTAATVVLLRERYATGGVSLSQLAAEFGVSVKCVHNAILRITWRHVP